MEKAALRLAYKSGAVQAIKEVLGDVQMNRFDEKAQERLSQSLDEGFESWFTELEPLMKMFGKKMG